MDSWKGKLLFMLASMRRTKAFPWGKVAHRKAGRVRPQAPYKRATGRSPALSESLMREKLHRFA